MKQAALIPDGLREAIELFPPKDLPKLNGGRPCVSHRASLAGIVCVLKTGIPCQTLPAELGCGSGSASWRRLRDWQKVGVWTRLHELRLNRLGDQPVLDWSRAGPDSISVRAKRGASRRGQTQAIVATVLTP